MSWWDDQRFYRRFWYRSWISWGWIVAFVPLALAWLIPWLVYR